MWAANRNTQVRGGTGIFTGRPAYVWISNQIGNTGVLTGFEQVDEHDRSSVQPESERLQADERHRRAGSELRAGVTDPNFKFPQVWRTNIAVDRRLPWGWTGTVEFIYKRDVNGIYYINANLPAAQTHVRRRRHAAMRLDRNRINNGVGNRISNAIVLKNQNDGRSWNFGVLGAQELDAGHDGDRAITTARARTPSIPARSRSGRGAATALGRSEQPRAGIRRESPGHRFYLAGSYTQGVLQLRRDHVVRVLGDRAPSATPATSSRAT